MAGTGLYFDTGYVYTEAEHRQQPAVSGPLRNGHVLVHILLFEFVRPYRSLRGSSSSSSSSSSSCSSSSSSSSSSYFCECEVLFDVPFDELLRLNEMPPDSLVMSSVKGAMERLGNPHPDVEWLIMSLIQRECNAIVGERPIGPVSSHLASMETVITIYANLISRVLVLDDDLDEEHMVNVVVPEESFGGTSGLLTRAAELVEKIERFVIGGR